MEKRIRNPKKLSAGFWNPCQLYNYLTGGPWDRGWTSLGLIFLISKMEEID